MGTSLVRDPVARRTVHAMDAAHAQIRSRIAASGATRVAVVAHPVGGAAAPRVALRADEPFHAASTMKVPVLVELERRAAVGELALDDTLVVRNAFASIADGSAYALDPADDSERALYAREGEPVPLRELARLAITVSSNLATNLLVDLLGASAITATMRALGLPSLVVRRGVEDGPAWRAGLNNEVTARGLAALLDGIARGVVVSAAASADMLAILRAQAFDEGIPSGLPPGTDVAHKTGSITDVYHDAGVIFPPDAPPYVLVVLTEGLDETEAAPALVAAISRVVHAALGGASR